MRNIEGLLRQYTQEHTENDVFTGSDLEQLHDMYAGEQSGDIFDIMCGCLRVGYMIGVNESKHI